MNLNSIELQKAELRSQVLERLKNQSAEDRRKKSSFILEELSTFVELRKGQVWMFYVSLLEEVDTLPLLKAALEAGCTVTVPFVDKNSNSLLSVPIGNPETDLERGNYGILEPKKELVVRFDIHQLEVVLVPGIAFDREGRRLGRGKGYYDRFLKSLPAKVKTIGLAYDFQFFERIPANHLDMPVQKVITN